jgi:hypothetical protein
VSGWTFPVDEVEALRARLSHASRIGRGGLQQMGLRGAERIGRWSTAEAALRIAAAVTAGRR